MAIVRRIKSIRITGPIVFMVASLCATFVLSSFINSYRNLCIKNYSVVKAKGVSSRIIKADHAVVTITIAHKGSNMHDLSARRLKDYEECLAYIERCGFGKEDITSVDHCYKDMSHQAKSYINRYVSSEKSNFRSPELYLIRLKDYEDKIKKSNLDGSKDVDLVSDFKVLADIMIPCEIVTTIVISTDKVDLVEQLDRAMISFGEGKNNLVVHVTKDYSLSNIDNLRQTMINDTINDACNRALIITGIMGSKIDKVLGCNFNKFTIEPHGHRVSAGGAGSDERGHQSPYMHVYVTADVRVGVRG